MTAAQLMLPANRAFDSNGFPEAGATVKLYQSGTTTPANFYADAALTIVLGSTLTANAAGRIVTPAYQDRLTPFRLKVFDAAGDELDDIDPFYFGSTYTTLVSTASTNVATRTAMAAIVGVAGAVVNLTESGREGTFVFDSTNFVTKFGANLSTIDPQQGIYVAPSSDTTGASGAWVRKFSGSVNAGWFGLIEGNNSANGLANSTAIEAMFTVLTARRFETAISDGLERVQLPFGTYWFARTIEPTCAVVLEGHNGGFGATNPALKFPTGVTGIRLQGNLTSGSNIKDGVSHNQASGSVLRNFALIGAFSGTEAEAHGVQSRTVVYIENVCASGFEGDGFHMFAQTSSGSGAEPPYGNVNTSKLERVTANSCRDGIAFDGGDSNACTIIAPNCNQNRRWGINDSSFLGNSYFGGQLATNGVTAANDGVSIGASLTVFSGYTYYAISGQEPGASTNPPSGTATDNTWWGYKSGTGTDVPTSGRPAWTSGMLVRAGGCVMADGVGATNEFFGVYAEQDQGKAQIAQATVIHGGYLAAWVYAGNTVTNDGITVRGLQGTLRTKAAFWADGGSTIAGVGEGGGNTNNTLIYGLHSTYAPSAWRLRFRSTLAGDLQFDYGGADANVPYRITGPNTAQQFGRGAVAPYVFAPNDLAVSDNAKNVTNARRLMVDTVAPTTGAHANGEFVHYRGATSGQLGFICRVAGTPGTWDTLYAMTGPATTGWVADTGTTKRTANATYTKGATLTYSATYVQAEQTAMATRMAAVEQALQDAMQTIKALKDDLLAAKAGISV